MTFATRLRSGTYRARNDLTASRWNRSRATDSQRQKLIALAQPVDQGRADAKAGRDFANRHEPLVRTGIASTSRTTGAPNGVSMYPLSAKRSERAGSASPVISDG
jgi:hypothetical protein